VRTFFDTGDPKPEPGSEVFVLRKVPGPRTEVLPVLAKLSEMMVSLVTIIV
jgi:hypothetical protein